MAQQAEEASMAKDISIEVVIPLEPQSFEKTEAVASSSRKRRRRSPPVHHRPITRSLTRTSRLSAHPLSTSLNSLDTPLDPAALGPSHYVSPALIHQPHQMAPSLGLHPQIRTQSPFRPRKGTRVRSRRDLATAKRRHARRKGSVHSRNQSCILDATISQSPAHGDAATLDHPPSSPSYTQATAELSTHPPPKPLHNSSPHQGHRAQTTTHIGHPAQTTTHIGHPAQTITHTGHHVEPSSHQKGHAQTSLHQEHHAELSPYEVFSMRQHQSEFAQSVLHRGTPHIGLQVPHHASPVHVALHNGPAAQPSQEMLLRAVKPQHHVPHRNSDETFYGEASCAASLIPGLSKSPLHMQKPSEIKVQTPQQKFVGHPQHAVSTPTPAHTSTCRGPQASSQTASQYHQMNSPSSSSMPVSMRPNNNVGVQKASEYHAQKGLSACESLPQRQQPSHIAVPMSTFMPPSLPPLPPSPSHSHSTSPPLSRRSDQGDVGVYKTPQSNQRTNASSGSVLPSLPSASISPLTSRPPSTAGSSFDTHDQRHKTPGLKYMHP